MGWFSAVMLVASAGVKAYRYLQNKPNYKSTTWADVYHNDPKVPDLAVTHDVPVPVVYGECLVDGNVIFKEATVSATTDYAVGVCEGEIDAINGVYVNDKSLLDITGCSWTGYTGTGAQTADARFTTNFSDLACIENAVVNSGAPGNVYDWTTAGKLECTKASGVYHATMLKFDLSSIPVASGSDISSATLQFYTTYTPSIGSSVAVYEIDDDTWHDMDVTWDDVTKGDLIDTVAVTPNVTITVDVSAFVQAEFDGDGKASFFLQVPSAAADANVYIAPNIIFGAPDLLVQYTPADMVNFRHTAYVAVTMAESNAWNGSSKFKVSVRGKKIAYYSGGWTSGYNNNPAYCILDQLTNSRYGADISSSLINTTTFRTVATYCDASITNEDGVSEKRATCDVCFNGRESVRSRIDAILASFGGYLYYMDGQICLGVDCSGSSSHAFTEDNIIDGSFNFGMIDKSNTANDITVVYTDAANGYEKCSINVKNQSLISTYGRNADEISLDCINRYSQASRMAMYYINKTALSEWYCSFRVSINNLDVAPGDLCTVTHSLAGWTAKTFRIFAIEEADNDEIDIYCEEYDANLYTDEGLPYTPNEGSHLVNPAEVPPIVTGLTLTETHTIGDDGTYIPQIKVEWTVPDYQYILRYIVWYKLHADSEYIFWELSVDSLAYISVAAAGQYDVIVQTENQLSGTRSDFGTSPSDTITLAGKTAPPSDVSFNDINCTFYSKVNLEWLPITDADLAYYELRTDTNWGNATNRVFVGKTTNYIEMNPAASSITYYIKARDLSDNYSDNADSITMTKSAPVLGTIVVDFTGKDCILSWDHDEDEDFKYYQVKVFSDAARTALIRTEKILSPPYVYKFELNKADNSGTPIRHPYFSIKKYSAHSQYDNDNCDGANAAPSAPADLTLTAGQGKLFISWTALADSDIIGYNIYAKTSNPPDVLVGFVNAANFTFDPEGENTYYVQVAGVDAFGEGTKCSAESQTTNPYALTNYSLDVPITSGINYTAAAGVLKWTTGKLWYEDAEYTIAAETTGTNDEFIYWDKDSPTAFQHSGTAPALDDDVWVMAYFDGTDVYSAFAQKIIHGGLIQASSIEAEKLSVDSLSAISADLGTVTSGTMQTAASGQRVVIDGSANNMKFYDDTGSAPVVLIDDSIYSTYAGIKVGDGTSNIGVIEVNGATGDNMVRILGSGDAVVVHLKDGTVGYYVDDMTPTGADALFQGFRNGVLKFQVASDGDILTAGDITFDKSTHDTTITATAPAADRTLTIPDPGVNASFVMTEGAQTVNGVKTFGSFPITPSSAPSTDYQVANKKYVDDNAGGASHDILSATHTDSTASAVSRGSIITGQGSTPKWAELNVGTAGQVLKSDGTDVAWAANTPTPAGSDTHVQYNNGGALGGDAALVFDDAHGRLSASSLKSGDQNYFDTSTTDAYQDGLFVVSSADSGINNYGASIAFSRHKSTYRHCAIAVKQHTSDGDQVGLTIFTHPTTTSADAMVAAIDIDHNGNIHLLNGATVFRNVSWSLLSGKLRGTADPTLSKIKDNGSGSTGVYAYSFPWGQTKEIFGSITIPLDYKAGSNLYPHINRMLTNNPVDADDSIRCGLEYTWVEEDGTLGKTTVAELEIAAGADAGTKLLRSELTAISGTNHAAGSTLIFRFYREASTITESEFDMWVTSIDFEYESDRLGADATTV